MGALDIVDSVAAEAEPAGGEPGPAEGAKGRWPAEIGEALGIPRGAGSGVTGGALPVKGGLVIGFSRMNRIATTRCLSIGKRESEYGCACHE